jgi:phosphohistidine phosphatase
VGEEADMELYFIRHAIAEPLGEGNDFLDERRRLTAEGRERMHQAALGLRALGVEFDLVLTSPLARAVETALIIGEVFEMDRGLIEQVAALRPEATPTSIFTVIKKQSGVESIALVGHQPSLGQEISRIVCGYADASIQLKKGGVCSVKVTETVPTIRGSLEWLLTPKQLRMIS